MNPSLLQRLQRKIDKSLAGLVSIDQWILLIGSGSSYDNLQWQSLRPVLPEKDRYWADPFVIQKNNQTYVFAEEKMYATGRGRIICLTFDRAGSLVSRQVVLERPYHLSYPFMFEHKGELYMIPETASNLTIELYRCMRFPDQWQYEKSLLRDIYAVDTTLLHHDQTWWMFTNVKSSGGSSLDALHLFFAEDPLSEAWRPHPLNPVVKDLRSARPAGNIFMKDEQLIRPSQDCSRRYGYAIRFNQILKLNKKEYSETNVSTFTPRGRYLATHTFNQAGDVLVVDAVLRRWK